MRRIHAVTLATVASLLAACSSGSTAAAVPATPSVSAAPSPAAPADGGSYDSPRDIVAKMEAARIPCSDYTPLANAIGARDRGHCRGGDMVVSVYDREGDVQKQVEFHRGGGVGVAMLTGRNWTVYFDDVETLKLAKSVLGGTLIFEPK